MTVASARRFTPADRTGFTLPAFLRRAAADSPDKCCVRTLAGESLT